MGSLTMRAELTALLVAFALLLLASERLLAARAVMG
jgi:hypothetical protein